jgi:hypothetical protein
LYCFFALRKGGVIRGLNPNLGNPLFDFQHWEILLD